MKKKKLTVRALDSVLKAVPQLHLLYAKREYGYSWKYLIRTWRLSEARPKERWFAGFPVTKPIDFYSKLSRRQRAEIVTYRCVNRCCSIWWHPKKGNTGGFGPAGCSCDNLKDPRDLEKGPLK